MKHVERISGNVPSGLAVGSLYLSVLVDTLGAEWQQPLRGIDCAARMLPI